MLQTISQRKPFQGRSRKWMGGGLQYGRRGEGKKEGGL